jgi:hypothetical protein
MVRSEPLHLHEASLHMKIHIKNKQIYCSILMSKVPAYSFLNLMLRAFFEGQKADKLSTGLKFSEVYSVR